MEDYSRQTVLDKSVFTTLPFPNNHNSNSQNTHDCISYLPTSFPSPEREEKQWESTTIDRFLFSMWASKSFFFKEVISSDKLLKITEKRKRYKTPGGKKMPKQIFQTEILISTSSSFSCPSMNLGSVLRSPTSQSDRKSIILPQS